MSSSSVVACTNWSAMPGAEIRKVAVSAAAFSSAGASSVTTCHVLQFAALKLRVAPLRIAMPSPPTRSTLKTTKPDGALVRRIKNRPEPSSRTYTFVVDNSGFGSGHSVPQTSHSDTHT